MIFFYFLCFFSNFVTRLRLLTLIFLELTLFNRLCMILHGLFMMIDPIFLSFHTKEMKIYFCNVRLIHITVINFGKFHF